VDPTAPDYIYIQATKIYCILRDTFKNCFCSSALTAKLKIRKTQCDKMAHGDSEAAVWQMWQKALFGIHKVTCLMANILQVICR